MTTLSLENIPVFNTLPPEIREAISAAAQPVTLAAGEILFQEGDPATNLYLRVSGRCMMSQNAQPLGEVRGQRLLEPVIVLGGLTHTQRAVALDDCVFMAWGIDDLWQNAHFARAARAYLAGTLLQAQQDADRLSAPVHYAYSGAVLHPGPFVFKNVTLHILLCAADLSAYRELLPPGITPVKAAWRKRDAVFIAVADFPLAYPEHAPEAQFHYTETTYFVPVRSGGKFGLFPLWIYPSAWEPILLGREIYGFPKQLGTTMIDNTHATLHVDGEQHFSYQYSRTETAGEPRLIRGLSDWIGIEGRFTEAAFRLGDTVLEAVGSPLYRRVSVYNRKRIPAPGTNSSAPQFEVDALTQAVFSVMHWQRIERVHDPKLAIYGGPLRGADVTLRQAFVARLDMRLSTGRIQQNYLDNGKTAP